MMTSKILIISYVMGETTCVSPKTLFLSSQCSFSNTSQIISFTLLRRTCRLKQGKRFSKMRFKGLQSFMTMILSTQVTYIRFLDWVQVVAKFHVLWQTSRQTTFSSTGKVAKMESLSTEFSLGTSRMPHISLLDRI